jgi:hypothetical protein
MFERFARNRASLRQRDIAESKLLLWELVTHEPTVLQCFNVIESTCMSQGLFCRIDGEACSEKFSKFVERHYTAFCKQALRAFFTYGFVPWVVRKLDDGEEVPEVLPNGTFHWYTEVPSKSGQAVVQQENPGLVTYRVKITAPLDIKDEDVEVFVFIPPALDVSIYSMLYATVPSPLSHVLVDYKNLRQAQIRRSHADAWNTTAKLICKFKPTVRVQEDPTSSLMDFADDSYLTSGMYGGMPLFAQLAATNLWSRDAQIRKQFETAPGTHQPDVFTLPRDHEVHQQPMLEPCEDIEFLLRKFQRDVCAVMGVPDDMMGVTQRGGVETAKKTMASGRVFTTNMQDICRYIAQLLWAVYKRIYGKDNAEFILIPMPRMEIESIADLKVLSEIGAINPDMSLQISQILLGEDIDNKRRRMDLQRGQSVQKKENFLLSPDEVQNLKGKKRQGEADDKKRQGEADDKKRQGEAGDRESGKKRPH